MGTDTRIAPPDCENCGTEKSTTYICWKCVDRFNTRQSAAITERDRLAAENATLTATLDRLRKVVPQDINRRGYSTRDVLRCHAILYPTQENEHGN